MTPKALICNKQDMRLLLWNVEFGKHTRSIQRLNELVSTRSCDVACVTETTLEHLAGRENVLRSRGDYGYDNRAGLRQKITLWSNLPWSEIDFEGESELPAGRFLSGVTHGVRFIGVCIPWAMAHVTSGTKTKFQWEDHQTYLQGLNRILRRYRDSPMPICILGDFNQTIPATNWNERVFPNLMDTLGSNFRVWTEGITEREGKALIDHVATTNTGKFTIDEIIERTDDDGHALSDHVGVIGTLSLLPSTHV